MLKYLNSILDYWIPVHVKSDPDLHLKGRMMVESCLLVLPLMAFYTIFYVMVGHPWGAVGTAYGFVTACLDLWDFSRRGNFRFSGNFFCFTAFIILTNFTFTTYGLNTQIAPWIIMVPMSGFMLVGIRSGIFWSVASVALVMALFILETAQVRMPEFMPRESLPIVNMASLIGLIGYIVVILLNNDFGRRKMLTDLRRAKADIETKNAEITAINQSLEVTVAQRTARLQAANAELDTFLYESSHALRRPLVRIIGLLGLIQSGCTGEEKEEFMRLISFTAHNMDAMLHDLLLVSQIFDHELRQEEVVLADVVNEAALPFHDPEVEFRNGIAPGRVLVTDGVLLRIALEKLLDNACFFRKEGGRHQVHLRAFHDDGRVAMEVEDNGTGIDAGAMGDLFKMFSRGSERSKGSGLGLFIVRKAMDRLGVEVTLESEKGSHTRVRLLFPKIP
jgi:signal transduction histidine kinase